MMVKDLMKDLEKGDRTKEMLKIESFETTLNVPFPFMDQLAYAQLQQSFMGRQAQQANTGWPQSMWHQAQAIGGF